MTSKLPVNTYADPEYDRAHQKTFAPPKIAPIKSVLPPNVTRADFETALRDLIAIVGRTQVFIGDALAHYIDPYELYENDESKRKMPSAAVCPESTGELSQVLQVAKKFNIPLWTFSRGKNLGYGGPAPRLNGSVALDLHRMNRVLEVNDEQGYAVVEPGVTFQDLYNYCIEHGKKVWPSIPSLGWGSIIGNTLDRGVGYGAYANHHQYTAGLEVMLGDGDLVRTGQWGITNSPTAFVSKFSYGPSVEGLFLQSNLGVVTKLSMWVAPRPPAFMSCSFSVPEDEDIEVLVDALAEMRRTSLIPNMIWVQNFGEILCIRGKRNTFWKGEGAIPKWRLKELQRELKVGSWVARWGLYGPERVLSAQLAEIKEQLSRKAPTGTMEGFLYTEENGKPLDAKSIPPEHGLMLAGVPSLFSLPLMDWPLGESGKAAHGDYAPVLPSTGKHIQGWVRACQDIYAAADLDFMVDFFMHERHSVCTSMYAYDQLSSEQCKNVEKAYNEMHKVAKDKGYGMYRGHVNHMDEIADLNEFNNHAYNRFVEKIKDAVDPDGILSPGKQGIWPKKYRQFREVSESSRSTRGKL
ncbi:hypothetical protein AYO20_07568 [Fonsecaea nubica]|uniref:FAD-binding PCMH-type domain-containing protein n=1 Tax=Fonsecaea nubica TaxID=856822 RepID=A0A178CUG2_9EURO|nr:hypothetical protein AYO20_07568 [Fonsecaea nubica]OAL33086.1 hypothetical protein AYO20_07568 [Fonsecaea nubica]